MAYAEVALLSGVVDTPLTYRVPHEMAVAAGCVVTVPLQQRLLAGVVLALHDAPPHAVRAIRDIHSLVDSQPVLDARRLELARWISAEYFSPLGRSCALMIPAGCTPNSARSYSIGTVAATPTGDEARVLDLVRIRGTTLESRLKIEMRRQHIAHWRDLLASMVERGLLVRTATVELPKMRPSRSTLAQLAISEAVLELVLEKLREQNTTAALRRAAAVTHLQQKNGLAWADWLMAETAATRDDLAWLQERGYVQLGDAERWRDPLSDVDYIVRDAPPLTSDQAAAWHAILAEMQHAQGNWKMAEFLLRGVTGSGKTEVYMRAVEAALQAGRGSIVLVPEISLTPQTARRFLERFPGKVALIHSKLRPGERYDTWRRIRSGELAVVVGARSALFAPVPNIGVIVLDEEHDASYKQDRSPRYDARRVARELARLHRATLIFGSATPSLEVMHDFTGADGRMTARFLELPNRVRSHALRAGDIAARLGVDATTAHESSTVVYQPMPSVQVIDMRAELRGGNMGVLSGALHGALSETLSRGEQALLFLNRRGMASCVVCRDCGLAVRCPNDDVPLTLHGGGAVNRGPMILKCHQCNHSEQSPKACPGCGSSRIKFIGLGTQRIEELVNEHFPKARVVRWDRDTASQRGASEQLLQRFVNRQADVLIGTQMIAKGLDLPMVTLVGIVLADVGLFLPDFRASERVFDLMEQVAGRAGRSLLRGRVLVQTYNPDHPAIAFAQHHDVTGFAAYENAERKKLDLPPLIRLVRFEFCEENEERARADCEQFARQLRAALPAPGGLIGPSACYFARRSRQFRWQVIARTPAPRELLAILKVPANCTVDVDPMNML